MGAPPPRMNNASVRITFMWRHVHATDAKGEAAKKEDEAAKAESMTRFVGDLVTHLQRVVGAGAKPYMIRRAPGGYEVVVTDFTQREVILHDYKKIRSEAEDFVSRDGRLTVDEWDGVSYTKDGNTFRSVQNLFDIL